MKAGTLRFALHYALRSLRRDLTRTLLACLCIAFGVLSLASMHLLANTLLNGSLFDLRLKYGGDAEIDPPTGAAVLDASDMAQIEQWRQDGLIADYTPISRGSGWLLRTPDSGRVTFLMAAYGIDPATYPLIGTLTLREPANATPADVLNEPTDALLTRDIADPMGLQVGDTFLLSGGEATPTELTLAGIIGSTPSQAGKAVYYSLETARLLENQTDVVNAVPVLWGTQPNAADTVISSPYNVYVAQGGLEDESGLKVFDVMLKGAGVLGLLVGGIGVSNTLQVILARRKLEIAMLKTVGYQRRDLLLLIGLETGLIGFVSSIIGGALAIALTSKLIDILGRSGALMLSWTPDPTIVIGSVLMGIATAVIFGLQAILASSATRPVELLRNLPQKTTKRLLISRLSLYGLLMLVFGGLLGVIMGSLLEGLLMVVDGILLIVLLRGVFWVVLWLALKLPVPPMPMLRLARRSLNGRKMQSSLAVLALCAGSFAVTFAAISIWNAQEQVAIRRPSDEGYNLMIFTTPEHAAEIAGRVAMEGAAQLYTTYTLQGTVGAESIDIEGRAESDLQADIVLRTGTWQNEAETAVLPDHLTDSYSIGDTVTVEIHGVEHTLTIAGFYENTTDYQTNIAGQTSAWIVPLETALALGGERTQARVIASFPVSDLDAVTDTLGAQLTNALVFSKADLNNAMITTYQSLFAFSASIAGLAFVAGAVLIANSTGLSMIERRSEIGVFKAVGYTSGHVLRLLLGEYAFLGLLAGIFGIIGVIVLILLLNISVMEGSMQFHPVIASLMVLLSISVALVSAALVAWRPSHVRPLDILRYE